MTIQSGYPSLLNKIGQAQSKVTLLLADAALILKMFQGPQWGIFSDGKPVLKPDSVASEEVRREWQVSQAPVEQGGFQTYNKVALPIEIRVRMTKGGTDTERAEFLAAVDAIASGTGTYDVVAPDGTYTGMAFNRYGFRRSGHSGVGLLTVETGLIEIRTVGQVSGLVQTVNSASADPLNLGVQLPGLSEVKQYILDAVT